MERIDKQMQFILEVDKLKTINRQTYLSSELRKENDAEHSWHLALMCMVLGEYSNEDIDLFKVMSMVLIHDIVEIDAGDTYIYDDAGNETKSEREKLAADRIFNLLPKEQADHFISLWEEFELRETKEAKFAATLDRMQPVLLNDAANGLAWREHNVRKEQVYKKNEHTKEGSTQLWDYMQKIIEKNKLDGNLI